ncbi:MAG: cytochrome c family protein [Pseudomonadota bacterium]
MTDPANGNKDPLFGNKVAAAVLTTLLIAVGLPIIITTMTKVFSGHHGDHHDESNPFGLAYVPAEIVIEGAAPAEAEAVIDLGTLLANASVERGERAAALCAACHTFEKGGADGIGPHLWDIVGRDIGGVSGFAYSQAVRDFGGQWTYEHLDGYLENSAAYIPGTQMAQMVRKDERRADILAYLGSLSDNPLPFPEPAPAAPEEATAEGEADASGE